ncbi:DUF7019 family protein [Lentzea jiangxiensis]|uniref:Uncharacterized protein n=1 Tax=Lentzea jiangxiensis TaxID=641025 RepID=A0A1H0WEW5_9PSEU|nr:SAVMC3_10250 family protein [Lentzea jiangxiensis]SDP88826.1 hypothetical protein SAMN05421507_118148 [Lentzea jiangxiensis]
MSFQYFVYISDSKVDMLLQQIDPAATRKRTSELAVDLKFLKGKRGAEAVVGADRTARLERVVRYLTDFGDLGSVDEPGQFFWGMLPLTWGPLVGADGLSLVYFGGRTGQTVLGLGGSRAHVFGAPPQGEQDPLISRSMLPSLLDGIVKAPEVAAVLTEKYDGNAEALEAVRRTTTDLRGPAQNMEFVARRLLHGKSAGGDTVLLGSPLYVALVD